MQYKIGDRVKIREDLICEEHYGTNNLLFANDMEIYRGKIGIIIGLNNSNNYKIKFEERLSSQWFVFNDDMFEDLVFKVGDKVKLREGCIVWHTYGGFTLTPPMVEILNSTPTISNINRLGEMNIGGDTTIERSYTFTKEMLQLITPVEEVLPDTIIADEYATIPSIVTGRTDGIPIPERFYGTGEVSSILNTRPLRAFEVAPEGFTSVTPEPPVEPIWIRFETPTGTTMEMLKAGSKVLMPMIKTRSYPWTENTTVSREIKRNKMGYCIVKNKSLSGCELSASDGSQTYNFNYSDVKLLNEGYTEGAIEPGRRIKTHQGKTKSFDWSFRDNQGYVNTEHYEQGFYTDGMFIRVYKELVTKPRGTVQYTMYVLLENAEGKELIAYDEALIAKFNTLHNQGSVQSAIRDRQEVEQRRAQEEERLARQQREEEERAVRNLRETAERERRLTEERELEELDKHGIWWHHKEL